MNAKMIMIMNSAAQSAVQKKAKERLQSVSGGTNFWLFLLLLLYPPKTPKSDREEEENSVSKEEDAEGDAEGDAVERCAEAMESITTPLKSCLHEIDLNFWTPKLNEVSPRSYSGPLFFMSFLVANNGIRDAASFGHKFDSHTKHAQYNIARHRNAIICKILNTLIPSPPPVSSPSGRGNGSGARSPTKALAQQLKRTACETDDDASTNGGEGSKRQREDKDEDDIEDADDDGDDANRKINAFNSKQCLSEAAEDPVLEQKIEEAVSAKMSQDKIAALGGMLSTFKLLMTLKRQNEEHCCPFFHCSELLYIASYNFDYVCDVLGLKKCFVQYATIIQAQLITVLSILNSLTLNLCSAMKDILVLGIMGPGVNQSGENQRNWDADKKNFLREIDNILGFCFERSAVVTTIQYSSDGGADSRPMYYWVHKTNMKYRLEMSPQSSIQGLPKFSKLSKPLLMMLEKAYNAHAIKVAKGAHVLNDSGSQRSKLKSITDLLGALTNSFDMKKGDIFMDIGGGELFVTELAHVITDEKVCASDNHAMCKYMKVLFQDSNGYTENDLEDGEAEDHGRQKRKRQKTK